MGRVIWINGAFSAGKTTVAELVVGKLGTAFLLDPEVIGAALRDHLVPPVSYPGDFQDLGSPEMLSATRPNGSTGSSLSR